MFEKPFTLEIIAPDKVVFRGSVGAVSAPGTLGGFQVLFNHAPLLSSLEVGKLIVKDTAGTDAVYATSGGYLEVRNNTVVVLVETAEPAATIDRDRAQAARDRAMRRLKSRDPAIDIARAEAALARALNRLRCSGYR